MPQRMHRASQCGRHWRMVQGVGGLAKAALGVLVGVTLGAAVAFAQDAATPDTQAPGNYGGGPDYGVARRDPDGRMCVTTPGLIGKPQYGNITTCYPDPSETEKSAEDSRY